jgi:hypothetical protein
MLRVLVLLACAWALAGCASVTRGWDNQMQFSSDPPGAIMQTTMGLSCVTPCVLKVSRKDEFIATFSKPGFQPESVSVRTQVAGTGAAGFAGNILLGGVIGMGVDAASGASLEQCPNPVAVRLRAINSREPPNPVPNNCSPPVDPNGPRVAESG